VTVFNSGSSIVQKAFAARKWKEVYLMDRQLFNLGLGSIGIFCFAATTVAAQDPGYQELRGNWQAIELVDNGRVIPAEAIPGWLPSGGRMEFVDNAIVFMSPKDGQRHARVFSIDATTYPKLFNVFDGSQISGHGIYRFDDGRLVVCLSSPSETPRPNDFSAREGSRRMMLVLVRADSKASVPATPAQATSATPVLNLPPPPANPAPSQLTTKPLTDAEIGKMLPGTWKCNDAYGAFFVTLEKSGVYTTYRESVETSTFQKVFRKLPVSSGTWKLKNGQVVLQCTSAVQADRLYKSFPFTIRSVTPTDLVFVDYAGNVAKAVRTQP
jgi:uncharacterized protein (TIGR03067 family)